MKPLSKLRAVARLRGITGINRADLIQKLLAYVHTAIASCLLALQHSVTPFSFCNICVQAFSPAHHLKEDSFLLYVQPVLASSFSPCRYHGGASVSSSSYSAPAASYSGSSYSSPAATPSNLEGLPLSELRALAKARGLRGDTRKELIKLLS